MSHFGLFGVLLLYQYATKTVNRLVLRVAEQRILDRTPKVRLKLGFHTLFVSTPEVPSSKATLPPHPA